ncbi:MAG: xanthine dehydrogenase family protein molybdopterin-binding subunit, partial [Candidatus Rokubacteria bacterium]|nr:xanthine dehydrogenase family protein molybdopterin-binding subunit [Candidatus Rokubacteria bacterium]
MLSAQTSRRDFLKGSGALVVGFSLAGPLAAARAQTVGTPLKPVTLDEVDAFLSIGVDGIVSVFTGKVDLGTGTRTALRQMAAEELDVTLDRIKLIEGDTALTPDQGPTWGSLSIQIGGVQIRQASATARKALLEMASKRLAIPVGELEVRYGVVRAKGDPTKHVSYSDLIGDREFRLKVDSKAPLKKPADYTIVGKSVPPVDGVAKVTGEWTYMHDVRVPGMLHARVIRPPAMGAQLLSVDESSVRGIKGLTKVVRLGNFLAVVAETEWAAIKAADQLKATWSAWEGLPDMDKLYQHVRNTPIAADEVPLKRGDVRAALATAAKTLSATYEFAIQLHGSIGPSCAIADYRDGQVTVWSSSQAPHWQRRELSMMLSIPPEKIRYIFLDGAGCWGRNGHEDAAADAALLSRELGRPVRVQWMRQDEHGWEPKGPPTLVDIRAGLDANGNVIAWQSEFWIPRRTDVGHGVPFVAASLAGLPHRDAMNPSTIFLNSKPEYAFPNAHVLVHRLQTTPFRPSWIRTPGRMQNTYATEVMMDELAAAAGADPLEFRMRHLNDPRGLVVLKTVANRAKWDSRPSPKKGADKATVATGRGISYIKYENVRTYVAAVAEVEVDRRSGVIRVKKFTIAHDCGLIINPDGVKNQIEGNVIQTVSRTLKEELRWDRSRVTSLDWATYPILTFPEVPEIDMELINRPNDPPAYLA